MVIEAIVNIKNVRIENIDELCKSSLNLNLNRIIKIVKEQQASCLLFTKDLSLDSSFNQYSKTSKNPPLY